MILTIFSTKISFKIKFIGLFLISLVFSCFVLISHVEANSNAASSAAAAWFVNNHNTTILKQHNNTKTESNSRSHNKMTSQKTKFMTDNFLFASVIILDAFLILLSFFV